MGYKRSKKFYNLVFKDSELAGLEVVVTSLSVGDLLKVVKLSENPEDLSSIDDMFKIFAKSLDSWNLEDEDGSPVPATLEGVRSQDVDFIMRIINPWVEALFGVPQNLGNESNSGENSQEELLQLASLSQSLQS